MPAKLLRLLAIFLIIISPLWTPVVWPLLTGAEDVSGLVILVISFVTVPAIASIGTITTLLTRNRTRAHFYSLLGFLLPALPVCIWLIASSY